jgi:hypothetical protein
MAQCHTGVSGGRAMPIVWEAYVEVPGRGDAAAVFVLEQRLGVTLPDPVRAVLRDHPGDAVEPAGIRVGTRSVTSFGAILYAGGQKDQPHYHYSVEFALEALAGWAESDGGTARGLVPFATNTATGYFCLDFRENPAGLPIVFVDLNYGIDEAGAILPVAPDLPTLFDRLHD